MKQIVAHRKLGALQGVALVAGLIAALILLNYLSAALLAPGLGDAAASAIFWLLGALLAVWVLRVYVVRYTYDLGEDVLRLSRSYGKRERPIEDIYLRQLLFVGAPEEAKARWPEARRVRALRDRGEFPTLALVYKSANGVRTALIQANPDLEARLRARVKAN